MSAFAEALRAAGLPGRVDERERLAIIVPEEIATGALAPSPEDRERILAVAREHGFTHVAIELTAPDGAPLPRRQS